MYKHARSKATDIPDRVKRIVRDRDHGVCIICGRRGDPWCHYIPRSQGGLGIEQNIVTLCPWCHVAYDATVDRKVIGEHIREYLMEQYPDWDESKLIYRNGGTT